MTGRTRLGQTPSSAESGSLKRSYRETRRPLGNPVERYEQYAVALGLGVSEGEQEEGYTDEKTQPLLRS
jgi:hypothetical protein